MNPPATYVDIAVSLEDHVATVELRRPPHNFFDVSLIEQLARAFEALDADSDCRAIVLAAQGKSFCAGANFGDGSSPAGPSVPSRTTRELYLEAVRLFATQKPIVAAVHGPAIGGGLGLALVADFRVTCPDARFSANFTRLGFHPGFGLTFTLPRLIGANRASLLFYTGRRLKGDEACEIGLADLLVPYAEVRHAASEIAREIAACAPLAVAATRATLRSGLVEQVRAATEHELEEQTRLRGTEDFREGVRASAERRAPNFKGR